MLAAARDVSERATSPAQLYFLPIMAIAVTTGMRLGEILALRWEDYSGGFFTIQRAKSGLKRQVPVAAGVVALLQQMPADSERLFPVNDVRGAWAIVKRQAEVEGRFHDLRHTAASLMVQGGADLASVREILGHASISTTQIYSHASQSSKKLAKKTLDSLLDSE